MPVRVALPLIFGVALATAAAAQTAAPPLVLEAKIPLGSVSGRIDHLAIDLPRQRLLVAELGNDSLGVVDLAGRRVLRTIGGLAEPQGVGYEPGTDTIFVANGGDGSVRLFRGGDLEPLGHIELGDDADDVRVDAAHRRVVVGYGQGALAIIDAASRKRVRDIRLPGHPEGFQLDPAGTSAFVNVPSFRELAIADLATGAVRSAPTDGLRSNFPLEIDPEAGRVLSVFRSPPAVAAFGTDDGRITAKAETCGDADDLFVDPRRHRIYISCGAGLIDVLQPGDGGFARIAQVATVSGARTSLFVPELDRLFVAVRAHAGDAAAIWVFRPMP